eukprot:847304-Heterocapsa_arctica.AAC.1
MPPLQSDLGQRAQRTVVAQEWMEKQLSSAAASRVLEQSSRYAGLTLQAKSVIKSDKHVLDTYIMEPKAGLDYLATAAHFAVDTYIDTCSSLPPSLPSCAAPVLATTSTGTVKWFNPKLGYGFITAADGSDVFMNIRACVDDGVPQQGDTVTYDLEQSR